jgi:hypothetical protein
MGMLLPKGSLQRVRPAWGMRSAWRAAIAVLATSCGSATAPPERLAPVFPELEFISSLPGLLRDKGILLVELMPVERSFRLAAGEYLTLTVTTHAGENETLRVLPEMCATDKGLFSCNRFTVSMESGRDIRVIEPHINDLGARLYIVAPVPVPNWGAVYAFGAWKPTMDAVRRLPGVVAIDLVALATTHSDSHHEARLAAAAPFDTALPTARDGVISALPGDTLTISYISSARSAIALKLVPPPPQESK